MKLRIEDLPPKMRQQVEAELREYDRPAAKQAIPAEPPKPKRHQTKTESEYARLYLSGKNPVYEALTFRLANGHRYTPDWVYWHDGRLHCVEVKGGYRLGSYQRARLAFDQAAIEWPTITWIWAEKRDGEWKSKSNTTEQARCKASPAPAGSALSG